MVYSCSVDKKSYIPFLLLFLGLFALQYFFFGPKVQETTDAPEQTVLETAKEKTEKEWILVAGESSLSRFVLENDLVQLVFLEGTGSICEINLKLKENKKDPSIVLPVAIDKNIIAQSPENALYPLFSAKVVTGSGESATLAPQKGGYMPLLRRSLKKEGGGLMQIPDEYGAFNLMHNGTVIGGFRVASFTHDTIVFKSGKGIMKSFTLTPAGVTPYILDVEITSSEPLSETTLTSGILEAEFVSNSYMPLLQYLSKNGSGTKLRSLKLPTQKNKKTSSDDINLLWTNNSSGFFGLIQNPVKAIPSKMESEWIQGDKVPSRLTLIDTARDEYPADNFPGYMTRLSLDGLSSIRMHTLLGPLDRSLLKQLDAAFVNQGETSPHLSEARTVTGIFSFLSEPFAKFCFFLMQFFHLITRSWGFSIILLTVAVRLLLYPLNNWSAKSMAKMQEIKPKIDALQAKFKNDKQRLMMEQHMLYKSEGINPFSGCLPLIIQLPFLIGMYELIRSSFELRGVSFIIPSWIGNLAAPDVLFSWSYPIPFIGTGFHLLPILLAFFTYLQQKMSQSKQDKSTMSDEQKQMQTMMVFMPFVMLVLFYKMPSGLNIYWLSTTLLGMLQQELVQRKMRTMKKARK